MGLVSYVAIPVLSSHWTARLLALISTGRVTRLNRVEAANKAIPSHRKEEVTLIIKTPSRRTQETYLFEKDTTLTRELRSCKGA